MYDIAVMITNTPIKLLGRDFAAISFRLSHWNNDFITYFATVQLFCLLATGMFIVFYLIVSCSKNGVKVKALADFNFEQVCVFLLLVLCALFDDPLFWVRRMKPSVELAVIAEIPASLFFTGLLTF